MKESNYNIFWDIEDKHYAFNSMTCALAEVEQEFYDILEGIRNNKITDNKRMLNDMSEGGFVVNDSFDELQYLKMKSYSGKFGSYGLGLTVALTMECNFSCPYCYEAPKRGFINDEVQEAIIKLIEDNAKKNQNISVTWYGGEPTLAIDIIETMSEKIIQICKKYNVEYSAFMITNGYLLTKNNIKKLKKSKISGIQVTLDGVPDVHNSRRKLKSGNNGTFDIIIENIKNTINSGIIVDIRVNVDKTNYTGIDDLLVILSKHGLQECEINFGHVNAYTEACSSIGDTCLSVSEYSDVLLDYQRSLNKNGFVADDYPMYPMPKSNYCCADTMNSFVIDPQGYLYKCWNDIGNKKKSVGNILCKETDYQQRDNLEKYILWTPFDFEECVSCKMLPICMGGCPYNGLYNLGKPECEKWKYSMDKVLKSICSLTVKNVDRD